MIKHIATIEIPVSDLHRSIEWYTGNLELTCAFKGKTNAMLSFGNTSPTIFLVETEEVIPPAFRNTYTGTEHSVVDFYTADLAETHRKLKENGVEAGRLNVMEGSQMGGFGFKDPDGNPLSVTNVLHEGQEGFDLK
ncbi:VOC family protein [Alteribacter natronophilus]|uniref:VOC family protein n=1 Tax=Alteribacter natronophilus TaxID=2583810 RepID=UPI00110D7D3F|nr:VOC family protein [Alteribacter natronophilus]TMW70356.1 VOC family protein [Alteribacter natronophilus]